MGRRRRSRRSRSARFAAGGSVRVVRVQRVLALSLDSLSEIFLPFVLRSFLDDIDRIAHRDYEPTDEDVVRARIRTTGVQEYRFLLDTMAGACLLIRLREMCVTSFRTDLKGGNVGREWVFYDVGGSRSLVSTFT